MKEKFKQLICKIASKIINKYDYHYITVESKFIFNNQAFIVSQYQHTQSWEETGRLNLEALEVTYNMNKKGEC